MRFWHFGERNQKTVSWRSLLSSLAHLLCPAMLVAVLRTPPKPTNQYFILKENRMTGLVPPPSVNQEINLFTPARVRESMCAHCCLLLATILLLQWGQVPTVRDLLLEEDVIPDDVLIYLEEGVPARVALAVNPFCRQSHFPLPNAVQAPAKIFFQKTNNKCMKVN